jgi:glucose dehydrogenase
VRRRRRRAERSAGAERPRYWRDGQDARTISVRGRYLFALNAKTGKPVKEFGDNGAVDLTQGYRLPARGYFWSGFPLVIKDVIVVAARCCGRSGPSPAPASSVTTPGSASRGSATAAPTAGR